MQVVNDSTRATCFQEVFTKSAGVGEGRGNRIGLRPGVASWNRFGWLSATAAAAAVSRSRSQSLGNLHAHFLSGSCCSAATSPSMPPHCTAVSCNFKFFVFSFLLLLFDIWFFVITSWRSERIERIAKLKICLPLPLTLATSCLPPVVASLSHCRIMQAAKNKNETGRQFRLVWLLFFENCAHFFENIFFGNAENLKAKIA